LLNRERRLWVDFERENSTLFTAGLNALTMVRRETLDPVELLDRIDDVLVLLRHVTYYNIMAPLSFALRRAVLGVAEEALDARQNAEVAAVEDLRTLAAETRQIFSADQLKTITNGSSLMTALAETPDGEMILAQLNHFIQEYGYLSPVGTDIAVATWHENPAPVRELLAQFVLHPPPPKPVADTSKNGKSGGPLLELAQRRFDLKGQVNTLYNRLLAELRWSILALEHQWVQSENLSQTGDIFFLTLEEIQAVLQAEHPPSWEILRARIRTRREQFDQDRQRQQVPYLVFGNDPPVLEHMLLAPQADGLQSLKGIGASAGIVEGPVRVMTHLETVEVGATPFILVVPYTDAGWTPLLARAKGLIAEVGGRLSHGAIIAREYGIPAVMDVAHATDRLHDGQWVRLNGQSGLVEVIEPPLSY
jgi:pyruvate,water dikinase